jgi:hypothetical protein
MAGPAYSLLPFSPSLSPLVLRSGHGDSGNYPALLSLRSLVCDLMRSCRTEGALYLSRALLIWL